MHACTAFSECMPACFDEWYQRSLVFWGQCGRLQVQPIGDVGEVGDLAVCLHSTEHAGRGQHAEN